MKIICTYDAEDIYGHLVHAYVVRHGNTIYDVYLPHDVDEAHVPLNDYGKPDVAISGKARVLNPCSVLGGKIVDAVMKHRGRVQS